MQHTVNRRIGLANPPIHRTGSRGEPGPVSTDFVAAAERHSDGVLDAVDSLGAVHHSAWTAEQVSDSILGALDARTPPARVVCASPTLRAALWIRALAPTIIDRVLKRRFGG